MIILTEPVALVTQSELLTGDGCVLTYSRHSRAYLHALFKSDTAAMHHITIHNIAYQVSAANPRASVSLAPQPQGLVPLIPPLLPKSSVCTSRTLVASTSHIVENDPCRSQVAETSSRTHPGLK